LERAGISEQTSGASRREIAESYLDVIACDKREAFAQGSNPVRRSPPSGEGGFDEAIHSFLLCGSMDCFASSGAHSRDPSARNDGVGQNPEPASRWFPDRPEQRINTGKSIIFPSATQNLDLNNSNFRSNIFPRVHSME
jgi:hypothetical protein